MQNREGAVTVEAWGEVRFADAASASVDITLADRLTDGWCPRASLTATRDTPPDWAATREFCDPRLGTAGRQQSFRVDVPARGDEAIQSVTVQLQFLCPAAASFCPQPNGSSVDGSSETLVNLPPLGGDPNEEPGGEPPDGFEPVRGPAQVKYLRLRRSRRTVARLTWAPRLLPEGSLWRAAGAPRLAAADRYRIRLEAGSHRWGVEWDGAVRRCRRSRCRTLGRVWIRARVRDGRVATSFGATRKWAWTDRP